MNVNEQIDHIVKKFLDHNDDDDNDADDEYNDSRDVITGGRIDDNVDYDKLDKVWDQCSKRWKNMYTILVRYKERKGHCNVPREHKEDGQSIGQWLNTQRKDKKKGAIDAIKEQKLEDLDIVWDLRDEQWENMYMLLVQYKKREGHCNVPQRYKENGQNIGQWLNTQRKYKKKGALDTVKKQKFDDVGLVWDQRLWKWEIKYTLLLQYKQREGHCNVPYGHKEDGHNLRYWLEHQCCSHRAGRLDAVRFRRLEDIGIV